MADQAAAHTPSRQSVRFANLLPVSASNGYRLQSAMIRQQQKLTAAAIVLAAGLALAWPLRKDDAVAAKTAVEESSASQVILPADATVDAPTKTPRGRAHDVWPTPESRNEVDDQQINQQQAGQQRARPADSNAPQASVAASLAALSPKLATRQPPLRRPALTAPPALPAEYQPQLRVDQPTELARSPAADRSLSASTDAAEPAPAAVEMHSYVIHNGDTLGRLAKRYLGDESRALEIFDLNRDVLDNPHILPLGAELRVPLGATRESDR